MNTTLKSQKYNDLPGLVNAIGQDSTYTKSFNNFPQRAISTEVNPSFYDRIFLVESFVQAVMKTNSQAFDFEKSLDGVKLVATHPPGVAFYSLLRVPRCHLPSKHEASVASQVLQLVDHQLGLHSAIFTGDPMSPISKDGLRIEGEFINTYIEKVRQVAKSNKSKQALEERNRKSSSDFLKAKRGLDRMTHNLASVFVLRVDLTHREMYGKECDLDEVSTQLKSYLTTLNELPLLGVIWKREFIAETGYRHHMVALLNTDPSTFPSHIYTEIHQRWLTATRNRGHAFFYSYDPANYRSAGCGYLVYPGHNYVPVLLESLKLMFERDRILRLEPSAKHSHSGVEVFTVASSKKVAYPTCL